MPLGLLLAALPLFFWPVITVVYALAPAWTLWTMALLFGSHFPPYAWLYQSRAMRFSAFMWLSPCRLPQQSSARGDLHLCR